MATYMTKQRRVLLTYLEGHPDQCFTARQIAGEVAAAGVSLSAVYRNLAELEGEGRIRRVTREGSRQVCYRYADARDCREHLHLSCSRCGRTYHMDLPATNHLIHTVEEDTDFQVDSAGTVLYGVCADCRRK